MFKLENIIRENIKKMNPYSSARNEYKGTAKIWLDANENPNETNLNRYPDPLQKPLRQAIALLKKVQPNQIFIGNGSDEAIDLLFRAFCEPNISKAFIFPPTYGMYTVSAAINNITVVELPLTKQFNLPPLKEIKKQFSATGLLFICSPNNPTGNSIALKTIQEVAKNFNGLVVLDEAYIDFSEQHSALSLLNNTPNLVVLQTFSKAYGLAGARVGMAFANAEIISVLNKIKPPYNVNTLSAQAALSVLLHSEKAIKQIDEIKKERERMKIALLGLQEVVKIYQSDANFLLVQFKNPDKVFAELLEAKVVVRNRTNEVKDCLRITIGTKEENNKLMKLLKAKK